MNELEKKFITMQQRRMGFVVFFIHNNPSWSTEEAVKAADEYLWGLSLKESRMQCN